jgi:hypothetical protein
MHIAFDGWQPDAMSWDGVSDSWVLYRVCPPGTHEYYFSSGQEPFLSDNNDMHKFVLAAEVPESKIRAVSNKTKGLIGFHCREVSRRAGTNNANACCMYVLEVPMCLHRRLILVHPDSLELRSILVRSRISTTKLVLI